jgi:hypothetical protein
MKEEVIKMANNETVVGDDASRKTIVNGEYSHPNFSYGPQRINLDKYNGEIAERQRHTGRGKIAGGIAALVILAQLPFAIGYQGVDGRVKPGATLSEMAHESGISQEALVRRNNITNPDNLKAGQQFVVYHNGPQGYFESLADLVRNIF